VLQSPVDDDINGTVDEIFFPLAALQLAVLDLENSISTLVVVELPSPLCDTWIIRLE
jgi:hypothetical protein